MRNELVDLVERGIVTSETIERAKELAEIKPAPQAWIHFFNQLFVWLGGLAFSLSLIFFFAYNWADLGRFAKFAVIEICLVAFAVVYIKAERYKLVANAAMIVSCLLVGALLALFGQTYQTGADTWQLFASWLVIITPWVVVARLIPAWVLWLALSNISVALYFNTFSANQFLLFSFADSHSWALFLLNTGALCVWQFLSASHAWMQKKWMLHLLGTASGLIITYIVWSSLLNFSSDIAMPMLVWGASLASVYYFYRRRTLDLFMLAGGCLSVVLVTVTFVAQSIQGIDDLAYFLILTMVVVVSGLIAAVWLKNVQREERDHE
ncbi:DUF2157 domain-containing protein [Vibrio tubiashii]|uniref:DUF2157 domain-containing protein n=1 Tax=Vibrio tubiashii TaxID=29498 RepID=UPI00234EDBD8|nr:DUF2157 domain-containing protein [Vibrio tubiashii]WCP66074.1 DUF2157 domain-containing protein [Vibrio tubiashii]